MGTEASFVLLFVVATAVAIGARRFRLPYTVALVLAGLVLGIVHLFEPPNLTKELLYSVFLPGLLFEAAFHLEFRDFWRDRTAIAALAVPGVAAAIGLTAVILEPIIKTLELGQGFGWPHAIVFGALIAATDPIAVVAMFKSLGAPRRLGVLMEGESLLNDGTAIVLFSLVLDMVSGGTGTAAGIVVEFVKIVGGGLALGVLIGLGISQVIKQIDDPMIEITLTTIAAYGSFLAAEQLGFSGSSRRCRPACCAATTRRAPACRRPRASPPRPSGNTSRSRSTPSSSCSWACACTSASWRRHGS